MESIRSEIESLEATELRLGLPGTEKLCLKTITSRGNNKRSSPDSDDCKSSTNVTQIGIGQETNPPAKAQVVGWPPVRSFRKNTLQPKNNSEAMDSSSLPGLFVKVSMDGAPYLRKIDLNVYKGYKDLRNGLETMFRCFSTGENGSDLAIAYEDKDGDWMLAGDVPWEMFTSSCKRLRIMKGSEAKGLAPGNCD